MRYTEYHCGVAVIRDRELLSAALAKLARHEDAEKAGKLVEDDIQKAIDVLTAMWTCEKGGCDGECSSCKNFEIPSKDLILSYDVAIAALQEKQHNDGLRQYGRLVKLPCALGDKAYWISDEDEDGNQVPTVKETWPIKGIAIEEDGFYIRTEGDYSHTYEKTGERWAYLTLAEAQAAAEKEKNGK